MEVSGGYPWPIDFERRYARTGPHGIIGAGVGMGVSPEPVRPESNHRMISKSLAWRHLLGGGFEAKSQRENLFSYYFQDSKFEGPVSHESEIYIWRVLMGLTGK